MTGLLPCPFCGAPGAVLRAAEKLWIAVCTAQAVDHSANCVSTRGERDAASRWNTRSAPANCKPSKCCEGELLVPMHSTNTKLCTGCKKEQPWPLEPGQKGTFS